MSDSVDFPAISFSCPKIWAQMQGDEKTRFCDVCQKNVHNLSMMNQGERRALLASTGESPCVAYFKHLNGTPMDVTALPETHPLKHMLTQAALVSMSAVAMSSIAMSARAIRDACTKDQEAPTTGHFGYSMILGMVCPPPGYKPPPPVMPLPGGVPEGLPLSPLSR